jgi:hypothetical protein
MNRAERRRLKRNEDKPPRTSVEYEQGFHDGMAHATEVLFYLTAYTIQYKLGFGKERLQKIMYAIFNNVDCFRTGHLEPRDFDTIREEMRLKYGIKLN